MSQSPNTRQSPRWQLLFNPCEHHLKSGDTHFHADDDSHPCTRNVRTSWTWGILKAERISGLGLSFAPWSTQRPPLRTSYSNQDFGQKPNGRREVELDYLVALRKHRLFDDISYGGSITHLSPRNDFQLAVFRPVSA
ncbi:hypothetical protein Landi51_00810 [Colletotrichum acutatum]